MPSLLASALVGALLLLDEPDTFLDIAHQAEVLDLVAGLRNDGQTVVAVLHDINGAIRYADHLVAMRDGHIVAEASPSGSSPRR